MNIFDAYIGSVAVDKRQDGGVRLAVCPKCDFRHLVAKGRMKVRCKRCAHIGKVGDSDEHFHGYRPVPSDDGDVFDASPVRADADVRQTPHNPSRT